MAAEAGRERLDMTLCAWGRGPFLTPDEVRQAADLGFQRIVLPLEPQSAKGQQAVLPEYERYIEQFA